MKKELSPNQEMVACEVCGRTILKGERTEPYLVPDGSRRLVCELCTRRAEQAGWLRESAHADMPTALPRAEPRRSILGRLRGRRRLEDEPSPAVVGEEADDRLEPPEWRAKPHTPRYAAAEEAPAVESAEPVDSAAAAPEYEPDYEAEYEPMPYEEAPPVEEPSPDARAIRRERRSRGRLRDPRHVRAVPTNADVKVERALELFNGSEFNRTTAGLVRTLGQPWVTALPHLESPSEVTIVVAWELSWYQYRVDLGDSDEPVALVDKGQELRELDESLREWNAFATADGALEPGAPPA